MGEMKFGQAGDYNGYSVVPYVVGAQRARLLTLDHSIAGRIVFWVVLGARSAAEAVVPADRAGGLTAVVAIPHEDAVLFDSVAARGIERVLEILRNAQARGLMRSAVPETPRSPSQAGCAWEFRVVSPAGGARRDSPLVSPGPVHM